MRWVLVVVACFSSLEYILFTVYDMVNALPTIHVAMPSPKYQCPLFQSINMRVNLS